ncbi:MAG: hypothetical protein ABSH22_13690 [Tepidisphaeraceae bacterium]|jgi:hypothetical protein
MFMAQSSRQWRGDAGLPPGCRAADIERSAGMPDDLSPAALWSLLDDRAQANLYRRFFQREWAELSAILEDAGGDRGALGDSFRALWIGWRNTALRRMAMSGEIQPGN